MKLGPSARLDDQKMVGFIVGDRLFRKINLKTINDMIFDCFVLNSIAILSIP